MFKTESRAYFKALGSLIAQLRKARGMTQAELARGIGVSQQAVFAYELGERRPSALVLVKIAKAFGVPVEDLIGLSKPANPKKGRLSPRAIWHAERIQQLSKTHQRFVIRIIDVCLDGTAPRKRIERSGGGRFVTQMHRSNSAADGARHE